MPKTTKADNNLENVLFNYNPYQNLWTAFHRDDWKAYWSGGKFKYTTFENASIDRVTYLAMTEGLNKKE